LVTPYCPESGDLIWIDFDPQVGHEQAGHRPALVLSPKSFNQRTSLAFICPITSRVKGYPFEVELPSTSAIRGVILCEHLRSMDWQGRGAKFAAGVSRDTLLEARETIARITGIVIE
jgi:mRNA interferase MazF